MPFKSEKQRKWMWANNPEMAKKWEKEESLTKESGILYKAGVKKYGKEGMKKIQQAAGKRKSHAEIGKIKDKYEKESVKESDLPITTKKQKVIQVKHKTSGKELIVVDTPKWRKKYKQMGFVVQESVNEANVIQKIDKLAKRNKYGTVDGTQMNGKTAREIMAIFKHPKMNSYRNQMLKMKVDDLVDLSWKLAKPLKIKVESVNEVERDYKDEYKKFQSSTKAKKYRAELNKYNRQKGTYGNGDGKDASHKGGKISGFEKESTNRGRREKSRLKKEDIMPDFEPMVDGIVDSVIKEYSINEDLTKLRALYAQLDKQFKNYNHKKISDFNKVDKFLKTKFKKGSSLPDIVASFYNDYRGGEEIGKNHKRLFKYAKKMQGESVNEAKLKLTKDKKKKISNYIWAAPKRIMKKRAWARMADYKKLHKNGVDYVMTNMDGKGVFLPVVFESVNEGDKRQYRDAYGKYYKTYEAFAREVMNIAKSASKISGNKTDEKIILKNFKKQVIPFAGLMSSWSKGRESNPHIDEGLLSEKMNPEQYHRYMQYVFDTQFNTPEEKKMKKSIIKKINKAQKKKGLPVFKEGSCGYGIDGEVGDEPAGPHLIKKKKKNESINEAATNIKRVELILKKRQAMKIDGYLVDMQTANVIMKVWKALSSSNKKKFAPLSIKKMAEVAWKLVR